MKRGLLRQRLAACALGWALPLVSGWAGPEALQEEGEFDIAAGPLGDVLLAIGRQLRGTMSFQPAAVAPYMAPSVRGRMTLRQALTLAVEPSGLTFAMTAGGTVTLTVPPVPAAPVASAASTLAAAPAADPAPPSAVLPQVEVYGSPRQANGVQALRSWSATRTDLALLDQSQAVSVLTADTLALLGESSSIDALQNVPGITPSVDSRRGSAMPSASLRVRGLPAAYTLSGLRTLRNELPFDTSLIERIEVPKGPNGTVGGVAEFRGRGGLVNVVRKQAGSFTGTDSTQSFSSRDGGTLRLTADKGGAWSEDLHWRLSGYGNQSGGTEGGYPRLGSSGVLAGLSLWRDDWRVVLAVQVDGRRDVPAPAGRGAEPVDVGGKTVFTPLEPGVRSPNDPSDRSLIRSADAQLELEWRLTPRWRAFWKGRIERVESDVRSHLLSAQLSSSVDSSNGRAMQLSLVGDLASGWIKHQLLLGWDAEKVATRKDAINFDGNGPDEPLQGFLREARQALLLQDHIQAGPWRLRLGVQRSHIPAREEASALTGGGLVVSAPMYATSWDAGVLLKLWQGASLYAGNQFAVETDNRPFVDAVIPFTGLRQRHLGLKLNLLDQRLSFTAEAFQLRQQDAQQAANGTFIPGRTSDGVELELAGRLRPALDLNFGLGFLRGADAHVKFFQGGPGVPLFVEGPARGLPARSMQLLLRYRLPERVLSGSSVGLEWRAMSSTLVDLEAGGSNFLELPGGGRIDLSLQRLLGPWTFKLFVNNIADRQLYGAADDARYLPLLPGRSMGLSASYRE
jgi:outer membrane receptor protein involved in Fe transport